MGLDSDEETSRVARLIRLPAILLLLVLFVGSLNAANWTLDAGGGVYWNSSSGLSQIRAWPATSWDTPNHYQLINWTWNENYNITTNLSLVFNAPLNSGAAYLWQNITTPNATTTTLYNVVSFNSTSSRACTFGDAGNTYFYSVNTTNQTGIIACFDSYSQNGSTWTLKSSRTAMGWGSILNQFTKTTYGSKEIYTINNVQFNTGTKYQTRFDYNVWGNNKFDLYAHGGSPQQVIDGQAPIYLVLDPWYGTTNCTETTILDGGVNYTIITATSNCLLNLTTAITNAAILAVAGGGAGGKDAVDFARGAGGGGGGGVNLSTGLNLSIGNYSVVVGNGGAISARAGDVGGNSSFGALVTARGGGGGCGANSSDGQQAATDGGSGGGACNGVSTGGAGTSGQGYKGGNGIGYDLSPYQDNGGGGGCGGAGTNGIGGTNVDSAGGAGCNYSTDGTNRAYSRGGWGAAGDLNDGPTCVGYGTGGNASRLTPAAGCPGIVIIRYATPIANTALSITYINLTPTTAYTTSTLLCNATATDNESSSINVSYNWFKNGVNQTALNGSINVTNNTNTNIANLTSGNLSVGDKWACYARAYVGSLYSDLNNSANVTILGLVSSANAITPSNSSQYPAYTTSINFVYNCSGTAASYLANITINGGLNTTAIPTPNNTNTNQAIPFGATGAYTWSVMCYNGTSNLSTTANNFAIVNFAPNITTFVFTPNGSAYQLGPLAFNVTYVDWENATATLYYSVFKNGSNQTALAGTKNFANDTLFLRRFFANVYLDYAGPFNPTDWWNVSVFVSDGGNQSAAVMSNNTTIGSYFSNVSFSNTAAYADLNFQATLNLLVSGAASSSAVFEFNGINHTSSSATGPPLHAFVANAAAPAGSYFGNWYYTAALSNGSTYTANNTTSTIFVNISGFYPCNATINTVALVYTIKDAILLTPVNASLNIVFSWLGDDGVLRADTVTQTNNTTSICIVPATLNHTTEITSETASATGYLYYINSWPGRVYSSSVTNRTILLVNSSFGSYYTFTVMNQYSAPISGAFIIITKGDTLIINTTTDVTGSIYVGLQQLAVYNVMAGASGYDNLSFVFTAGSTTTIPITLQIAAAGINLTSPYQFLNNVSYSISPLSRYFTTPTNLIFTVSSNNASLLGWGMKVYYNGSLASTQVSTVGAGGSMTYLAGQVGIYRVNVWFQQQGFGNFTPMGSVYIFSNGTSVGLGAAASTLQTGTAISPFGYYVIALILALMAAAFVSQYTVSGAALVGLLVLSGFTLLWPDGVVANVGFADITTTMLTVMTAVLTFAVLYLMHGV